MNSGSSPRESESVWGYPAVLFLHTFGMAILVGLIAAIDLKMLGVARQIPIAPMKRLLPLIWIGFTINAITGLILFGIDGPNKIHNEAFPIKLILIAIGMVILLAWQRKAFSRPDRPDDKVLAVLSLVVAPDGLCGEAGPMLAIHAWVPWLDATAPSMFIKNRT